MSALKPNDPLLRAGFNEDHLRRADQMGVPRLEFVLDEVKAICQRMPVSETLDVGTATSVLVVVYTA